MSVKLQDTRALLNLLCYQVKQNHLFPGGFHKSCHPRYMRYLISYRWINTFINHIWPSLQFAFAHMLKIVTLLSDVVCQKTWGPSLISKVAWLTRKVIFYCPGMICTTPANCSVITLFLPPATNAMRKPLKYSSHEYWEITILMINENRTRWKSLKMTPNLFCIMTSLCSLMIWYQNEIQYLCCRKDLPIFLWLQYSYPTHAGTPIQCHGIPGYDGQMEYHG